MLSTNQKDHYEFISDSTAIHPTVVQNKIKLIININVIIAVASEKTSVDHKSEQSTLWNSATLITISI